MLHHREVKSEKIEELYKNLETYGLEADFAATLRDNNFEPCSYFKTSVTENEKGISPEISDIDDNVIYLVNNFDDSIDYMNLCDADRKFIIAK